MPFARVHPNEAAAFRTRRGVKAKTDRLDAGLLADFAALELAGRGLASLVEGNEALREMVVRRRQLVDTLHAERCRAGTAQASAVRQTLAQVIAALETVLAQLEARSPARSRPTRRRRRPEKLADRDRRRPGLRPHHACRAPRTRPPLG